MDHLQTHIGRFERTVKANLTRQQLHWETEIDVSTCCYEYIRNLVHLGSKEVHGLWIHRAKPEPNLNFF